MKIKLENKTNRSSSVGSYVYPEDCFALFKQLENGQVTKQEFNDTIANMLYELVMNDKVCFVPFPAEPDCVKDYKHAIEMLKSDKNGRTLIPELYSKYNKITEFREYQEKRQNTLVNNLDNLDTLKKCKEKNKDKPEVIEKIDNITYDILMKLDASGIYGNKIVY